jgi:ankyrin repeat protein
VSEIRFIYRLHFSARAQARDFAATLQAATNQPPEVGNRELANALGLYSQDEGLPLSLDDISVTDQTVEAILVGSWKLAPDSQMPGALKDRGCKLLCCEYGPEDGKLAASCASSTRPLSRKQYEAALRRIDPSEEIWQLLNKGRHKEVAEMVTQHGLDPNTMIGPFPLFAQLLRTWKKSSTQHAITLLKAGANINPHTQIIGDLPYHSLPFFPLHLAALVLDETLMKALLDAGADVNGRDDQAQTALHFVAENCSGKAGQAAELLLSAGADINAYSPRHGTPLTKAKHVKLRELLIVHGAQLQWHEGADDEAMESQLRDVITYHDSVKLERLLAATTLTETERHRWLALAVEVGNCSALNMLWRDGDHMFMPVLGERKNVSGTPMLLASFLTHIPDMGLTMLHTLIERSRETPQPKFEGALLEPALWCLLHAIHEGQPSEIARSMIELGLPIDSPELCPLYRAIDNNFPDIVRLLLDKGVNPNFIRPYYHGPLHRAVEFKSYDCIPVLLAAGADREHKYCGETPLQYAIARRDKTAQKLLEL